MTDAPTTFFTAATTPSGEPGTKEQNTSTTEADERRQTTEDTSTTEQGGDEFITTVSPENNISTCPTATVMESIAWTLVAVLAVLFLSSLTINITQWWIYKKRQTSVKAPVYEMEGNPCYEATKVNQSGTADTSVQDVHVYDTVQGGRSN